MADAVSIDCKSIGVESSEGIRNYPASVAIVNEDKICVYNAVINPRNLQISDYRTRFHGIQAQDLSRGLHIKVVRQAVSRILKNCLLVGYDVSRSLRLLGLGHPEDNIRDVSTYHLYTRYKKYNPTLRQLTRSYLSRGLEAPRTPVKDATAAMDLYLKVAEFWEEELVNETDSSECDEDSYYTD